MSLRVCAEPNCPTLSKTTRCTQHTRERDKARGTRQQRGYGSAHEAERSRWQPVVATGQVRCARCHGLIDPAACWDLDHNDERTGYLGPSHAQCNRATAGRMTA